MEYPSKHKLEELNSLYMNRKFNAVITECLSLIDLFPKYFNLYNIIGASYASLEKYDDAIDYYQKSIKIKPEYPETYNNLGNVFKYKKNLDKAILYYKKALKYKPNFAEVYINLAVTYRLIGDLKKSLSSCKKSIKINPSLSSAYNNMGVVLMELGDLDGSIKSLKKAISMSSEEPSYYNNLGNTLRSNNNITEARKNYQKAILINPNYTPSLWNLIGTEKEISKANDWLNKCLKVDSNHKESILALAFLNAFEGSLDKFDEIKHSSLRDHPHARSYKWVLSLPELPKLFFYRWDLFDFVIEKSILTRPFYEYGVFKGQSFKYLIKKIKKGFGFDTFSGLPENWGKEKKGSYSSDGIIPKINGGNFISGNFEDSLPIFFSKPREMASIINFDADLYSSTICALNYSKNIIDSKTILIFDEFIMNENWENDEFKALNEFCSKNQYLFRVIAVSFFTKQVAVRIIKKNNV